MLAARQIVNAIATRITGLASTGSRVFVDRAQPVDVADMPCWVVTTGEEPVESQSINFPPLELHELTVELRGLVRALTNVGDLLDGLLEEALTAIYASASLGTGLANVTFTTTGLDRTLASDNGFDTGEVRITLRLRFNVIASAPQTIL